MLKAVVSGQETVASKSQHKTESRRIRKQREVCGNKGYGSEKIHLHNYREGSGDNAALTFALAPVG